MKITSGVIMASHLATALVGGILASALLSQCSRVTWHDNPTPLQSGEQPAGDPGLQQGRNGALGTVSDGIAGCFLPGAPVAVECLERAPRCPYEDGDPSGWPCLWVNPRTGLVWFIDSREYWD